jgi:hypothetical protein
MLLYSLLASGSSPENMKSLILLFTPDRLRCVMRGDVYLEQLHLFPLLLFVVLDSLVAVSKDLGFWTVRKSSSACCGRVAP